MSKTSTLLLLTLLLVSCTTQTHIGTEASSASSVAQQSSSAKTMPMKKDWKNFHKPSAEVLKTQLTALQFSVTQEEGTEAPFANDYWNNHDEGIYVDVVSGEPLFSSKDKYESGTGWPSFTKPLVTENITTRSDTQLSAERTEVRSMHGDSHLGHVFPDGPAPLGLRYCMNSAALRFVPKTKLVEEGYGEFTSLFE